MLFFCEFRPIDGQQSASHLFHPSTEILHGGGSAFGLWLVLVFCLFVGLSLSVSHFLAFVSHFFPISLHAGFWSASDDSCDLAPVRRPVRDTLPVNKQALVISRIPGSPLCSTCTDRNSESFCLGFFCLFVLFWLCWWCCLVLSFTTCTMFHFISPLCTDRNSESDGLGVFVVLVFFGAVVLVLLLPLTTCRVSTFRMMTCAHPTHGVHARGKKQSNVLSSQSGGGSNSHPAHIFFARVETPCVQRLCRSSCAGEERVTISVSGSLWGPA